MPNRDARDDGAAALPRAAARRFRPRLVPTVATLAAVALFVAAGNWQHRRMQDKEGLRARFDAAARLPPAALPDLAAAGDWPAQRFRPVVARGEYDAAHQILVDNKIHAGHAGYHVVTPLKVAGGITILVDRGWAPAGPTRALLPEAPPPQGTVDVVGRISFPPERYIELRAEDSPGPVWQNLDTARFAKATGLGVVPAIVEETVAPVPPDSLIRDWPAPDFGVDTHRIYMMQWYAFAALAVTLWVALNLRRRRSEAA